MNKQPKAELTSLTRRDLLKHGAGAWTAAVCAFPLLGSCEPEASNGAAPEPGELAQAALPRLVAGVRLPDSKLAHAATELVRTVSSETLYNHCVRTYLFAALSFKTSQTKFDEELVFLASILHDLGLVDSFMTDNERFEVDGADAAVAFLEQWSVPRPQLDKIWDAIALHTSIGIVSRKAPDIAAVSLGSGMDMGGIGLEQLDGTDVDEVLRHFPRLGFKREAIRTVLHICEKKPFSTLMTAFAEVGRAHDPFFLVPTLEDILLLAPFPD
jgi:predicted hydrolase (HD superfamily)